MELPSLSDCPCSALEGTQQKSKIKWTMIFKVRFFMFFPEIDHICNSKIKIRLKAKIILGKNLKVPSHPLRQSLLLELHSKWRGFPMWHLETYIRPNKYA